MKLFNTVSQRTELARDSLTGLDVLVEDIRVVIFCELMPVDLRIIYLFGVLRVKKQNNLLLWTYSLSSKGTITEKAHTFHQYTVHICNYAQCLFVGFFFLFLFLLP